MQRPCDRRMSSRIGNRESEGDCGTRWILSGRKGQSSDPVKDFTLHLESKRRYWKVWILFVFLYFLVLLWIECLEREWWQEQNWVLCAHDWKLKFGPQLLHRFLHNLSAAFLPSSTWGLCHESSTPVMGWLNPSGQIRGTRSACAPG